MAWLRSLELGDLLSQKYFMVKLAKNNRYFALNISGTKYILLLKGKYRMPMFKGIGQRKGYEFQGSLTVSLQVLFDKVDSKVNA